MSRRATVIGTMFLAAGATGVPAWGHDLTERVSVASSGVEGDADGLFPAVSADGRYVAFNSAATNLVPGDTNGTQDVFVRDRRLGQTARVSVAKGGTQGNDYSQNSSISADGRFVAFESNATNLVPGDTNGAPDIFVHDRQLGRTRRVSVGTDGDQGDSYSQGPLISAGGRFVAFNSAATNLVPNDSNGGTEDVFVRDRQEGTTTLVSLNAAGAQFAAPSFLTAISPFGRYVGFSVSLPTGLWLAFIHDRETGRTRRVSLGMGGARANGNVFIDAISVRGRFVALTSTATNLVPGDTNDAPDVFVRDLRTGSTRRVSVRPGGAQANAGSILASLSADGRYVSFQSNASNLVPGDTNDALDVFVHDRQSGRTARASVAAGGAQGDRNSENAELSADGRFVVFDSDATNLVPGDGNGAFDVFIASRR
jgi:Tol biopolymer transport system component